MNKKFSEIQTPKTIAEAVDQGIPLVMVQKVTGDIGIIQALELELIETAKLINIDSRLTLQSHQLAIIAQTILDQFKNESLQDFKLAFRKGATGFYGEVFRLDGIVITRWIQLYLDEKYSYVEEQHAKYKKIEGDPVNYKAFHERLSRERTTQNDNRQAEIDRRREEANKVLSGENEGYRPLTFEDVERRKLHDLWIRENYDLEGNKRPGFKEESEWLKNHIPQNGIG